MTVEELSTYRYTMYVKSYGRKRDGAKMHMIELTDMTVVCGANPDGYQFLGDKLTDIDIVGQKFEITHDSSSSIYSSARSIPGNPLYQICKKCLTKLGKRGYELRNNIKS